MYVYFWKCFSGFTLQCAVSLVPLFQLLLEKGRLVLSTNTNVDDFGVCFLISSLGLLSLMSPLKLKGISAQKPSWAFVHDRQQLFDQVAD